MGNVIDGFSVRQVYDRFLNIGEWDITSRNRFLLEISTSGASVSASDHRGVSVDRREERMRRRKTSAVSGSLIISTGEANNNITVLGQEKQVRNCLLFSCQEGESL